MPKLIHTHGPTLLSHQVWGFSLCVDTAPMRKYEKSRQGKSTKQIGNFRKGLNNYRGNPSQRLEWNLGNENASSARFEPRIRNVQTGQRIAVKLLSGFAMGFVATAKAFFSSPIGSQNVANLGNVFFSGFSTT